MMAEAQQMSCQPRLEPFKTSLVRNMYNHPFHSSSYCFYRFVIIAVLHSKLPELDL